MTGSPTNLNLAGQMALSNYTREWMMGQMIETVVSMATLLMLMVTALDLF